MAETSPEGSRPLTQYFVASSIDGFIADEHDNLDWLMQIDGGPSDDTNPYNEFIEDVGVLAMGATTYEWIQQHDTGPWAYGDRPTWVFTHRELAPIGGANLTFTQEDVATVHAAMLDAAGSRNIWLIGGGDLVGQFLDQDLLDEIWLSLTPVTLGAGAPLLPRRHTTPMRLESAVASRNGTFAHLRYAVH